MLEKPTKIECIKLIKNAQIIILPVPLLSDGKHIWGFTDLEISDIANNVKDGAHIFGLDAEKLPLKDKIHCFDYSKNEKYLLDMAYMTAEGTLGYILSNYKKMLNCESVNIIGYGRISKYLIDMFSMFDCNISVVLRDLNKFDKYKHKNVKPYCFDRLKYTLANSNIIVNTVPAEIINTDMLAYIDKDSLLIELASTPGGFNFDYAQKSGINAVKLLKLPGKCAPASAGRAVAECVINYLDKINIK